MTPKRDPRSTPKRPKIDIKNVIDSDAKNKRAYHGSTRRHWAETPPREAPQGLREGPPGTHVRAKRTLNIKH